MKPLGFEPNNIIKLFDGNPPWMNTLVPKQKD